MQEEEIAFSVVREMQPIGGPPGCQQRSLQSTFLEVFWQSIYPLTRCHFPLCRPNSVRNPSNTKGRETASVIAPLDFLLFSAYDITMVRKSRIFVTLRS